MATATPTATPTTTLRPPTSGRSATATPTRTDTPTREGPDDATAPTLVPPDDTVDEFGRAVALSDATAVVLAESHGAYVFEVDDGWRLTAELTPEDEPNFGGYHVSATLVGREAILGGPGAGSEGGGVYLFERTDRGWRQRHQFIPDEDRDKFGRSVAFDGNRVVVGDNNAPTPEQSWSGSAYVFERAGSDWTQEAALGGDDENLFGTSVAVAGETVLIGAPYAESGGEKTGAVYAYALVGGDWQRQETLRPDGAAGDSQFGQSVAVDGDIAVVGAPGTEGGSGYVFERTEAGWTRRARITGEEPDRHDAFGRSVAYADGTAVLGAPETAPTGRAYTFELADDWGQPRRLNAQASPENAEFGSAVAIHDRTVLVGAPAFRQSSPAYLFEL